MNRPLVVLLLTLGTVAGCATEASSKVYPRHQTQVAWTVDYGAVIAIDEITIEGERTAVGRVGGGLIGYEAGRAVGEGSGRRIAAAAGAVAGAVAGGAAEKRLTSQRGYQITVELDGKKQAIAIVQAADEHFAIGERVKVLRRGNGAARVTKT